MKISIYGQMKDETFYKIERKERIPNGGTNSKLEIDA
jgi:hypothetical protein